MWEFLSRREERGINIIYADNVSVYFSETYKLIYYIYEHMCPKHV
jgi:hypothetical protein